MPKKYLIIGGIIAFFFVILVVSFFLPKGGGRAPAAEPVELIWWKTFEDQENIMELAQAYQAVYKNVTIKFVKKDIATYEQELLDAIAAGRGPDIFTIHNDWLPRHIDKLAPMTPGLMTERQYRETFVDVASEDFIKNSQIYAVPLSVDVLALYYNKDILNSVGISEPPKTWPEVVSAVQKITRQDRNGDFIRSGIAMGMASNVNRGVDIVSLLMLQNGTQFYGPNGDVTIDQQVSGQDSNYNPAAVALEFYTQFANPAKKTYTWNAKTNNSVDAFSQGKLGMMLSYSYMREIIIDKAPNLNWSIAAAPQVDASGIKVNFANYWGEAVSKASKNQAVAWDFLKFATQKEVLTKY
ncbi:MAG TPA: extracellular solute-binding protein, partial [Verrucomicrobiae bacterium]|nr:extracellular solute-binding protein [Verrucomicrobiae bacterium]